MKIISHPVMRVAIFLPAALWLALTAAGSSQSAFSGRGGAPTDANLARAADPSQIPPVTVTKPGVSRAAPASPLAPEVRVASPVAPPSNMPPAPDSARGGNQPSAAGALPTAFPGTGAAFRPGDTFQLRMGGMPYEDAASFPVEYTIGGDGFVNIPLGGQIRAAGLTQSQLERGIERRLVEQKIFRWPTATINVPNVSRFVTVGGAVRAPGRQVWSADLTITSAIASAGGKGEFGSNKINLIRGGQVRRYDLKKIKARPADDERLLPGDQIELQ